MSSHAFAAVEAGLVIVVVFGLAVWQLIAVRRSIEADRAKAEPGPPERSQSNVAP